MAGNCEAVVLGVSVHYQAYMDDPCFNGSVSPRLPSLRHYFTVSSHSIILCLCMKVGMGSMDCYEKHFEEQLLSSTAAYYKLKASQWIEQVQ